MVSVAAVMIIRDEAEMLPLTLPPLVQTMDQVVIVDMRSSDNSRDICRALLREGDVLVDYDPANLYHFGFEHPRNYGGHHTTADWILAIDADEFATSKELRALVEWLQSAAPAEVNCLLRRNYDRLDEHTLGGLDALIADASYVEEEQGRFYRNHPTVRWAGLIHEEVWGPERMAGARRGTVPLTIHHLAHYKSAATSAADHRRKTLLYSYLLAKAYRYPGFRSGTNPFWFESYMRDHWDDIVAHANSCAREMSLDGFEDMSIDDQPADHDAG